MIGRFLFAVSLLWSAGSSAQKYPIWELYQDITIQGHRFVLPAQHAFGDLPPTIDGSIRFQPSDDSFRAILSGGWLAAHIDGYQPVLNDGIQSIMIRVVVGEQAARDRARIRPIDEDIWYARGNSSERVVTGKTEPNTGLHIISAIPERSGQDYWSFYLVDSLPDSTREYPKDPPWQAMICDKGKPALLPLGKMATSCYVSGSATPLTFFKVELRSENLRIKDRIVEAVADEIRSWLQRGEQFTEKERHASK